MGALNRHRDYLFLALTVTLSASLYVTEIALRILYRDSKIEAHVVVPDIRVTEEELVSTIYGYESKFLYGEKLQIYDVKSGRRRQLTDSRAACEYFARTKGKPSADCPPGQSGYGVPILRYRELPASEGPTMLLQSLQQT